MKYIVFLMGLSILTSLAALSQDSVCFIKKNRLVKYRKGYLITSKNDTLRGLIWHENDKTIWFIKGGLKIRTSKFKVASDIPSFLSVTMKTNQMQMPS